GADLAGSHLAVVAGAAAGEASGLDDAGGDDLVAHHFTRGAGAVVRELFVGDGGDFDVDVDAVEQRAADLGHVFFDLRDRAVALAAGVVAVAAGAGVESTDE